MSEYTLYKPRKATGKMRAVLLSILGVLVVGFAILALVFFPFFRNGIWRGSNLVQILEIISDEYDNLNFYNNMLGIDIMNSIDANTFERVVDTIALVAFEAVFIVVTMIVLAIIFILYVGGIVTRHKCMGVLMFISMTILCVADTMLLSTGYQVSGVIGLAPIISFVLSLTALVITLLIPSKKQIAREIEEVATFNERMKIASEMQASTQTAETTQSTSLAVGNVVNMGTYNGQALGWSVLRIESDTCLLVSNPILDATVFVEGEAASWESSLVRKWLSNAFYNSAFNDGEKQSIVRTTLTDTKTTDTAFLLSREEVLAYLPETTMRQAQIGWWTRTVSGENITYIETDGTPKEVTVGSGKAFGVRPAMWVKYK